MPATILKMPKPKVQLRCSSCGVTVDAACNCLAPIIVIKPRDAAAKAIAAHPEKSDRAIAKEIGVTKNTVMRARESGGPFGPSERRVGNDNKSYPASQPTRKQDSEETIWRRGLIHRATVAAADAKYENWSQFKVDQELVTVVKKASDAWTKLTTYLEKLHGKT